MSRGAVLLLYVVPLLLTAAFLASVGLGVLAVALLAVEAVVLGCVHAVRRTPQQPARPRDGSTVLLVAGAGIALVVTALLVLLRP